jgi:hypothetical protein
MLFPCKNSENAYYLARTDIAGYSKFDFNTKFISTHFKDFTNVANGGNYINIWDSNNWYHATNFFTPNNLLTPVLDVAVRDEGPSESDSDLNKILYVPGYANDLEPVHKITMNISTAKDTLSNVEEIIFSENIK